MAKVPDSPLVKAARLLDLVPFISTHQGISVEELADNFSISQDELLIDLNSLWMCGLPGYTPLELIDLSFDSGFVSIRNAETLERVRLLTKKELVVILIGLDLLTESIASDRADISQLIESLQSKVRAIVGEIATAKPIVNSAHRAVLVKALKERCDVIIEYHSMIRDEVSTRIVTPLELSEDHGFEILNAFCRKVQSFRTFRLDNIRTVIISDEVSTPYIPNLALAHQFQAQLYIHSRMRTTLERFRIEPSEYLNPVSALTASSFSQDWLLRNCLSTLGSTQILGPVDLLKALATKAQQTLALYRNQVFLN